MVTSPETYLLDRDQEHELLVKCWMTHDAMWFYHCTQKLGIESANQLNLSAVRGTATFEALRIYKAFGRRDVKTFEDVKEYLTRGLSLFAADFMGFNLSFPAHNIFRWEVPNCFVFQGVNKLGLISQYQCGVIERCKTWLDTLGVKYALTPENQGCQKLKTNGCVWEFRFELE
ncbi:MAG: hypothetical protein ACM3QZ_01405 [Solirubrobacterales bacterium]